MIAEWWRPLAQFHVHQTEVLVKKQFIPMLALAGLVVVGACNKGSDEKTTADTMTTTGTDTVNVPTAVPTTDTVVKQTTTTTDTIKGSAKDSVKKDDAKKKH